MSADNWTICPQCRLDAVEHRDTLRHELKDKYGSISHDKYMELVHQCDSLEDVDSQLENTLREDYELGMDGDEFIINYRAHCHACDFKYSFVKREKVL